MKGECTMSVDTNKDVVRRWIESWHTGKTGDVGEFISTGFVRHDPNMPEVRGIDGESALMEMYLAAFPDLRFTIEHLVAENDLVLARLTARGTHQGELLGTPPSGRQVTVAAMELYRLEDGKIAEQWVTMDSLGLLQQIGAIPAPSQEAG
jgi:steroid delta-isomerase-like uncharacterized protein